jgi:hypothetical protein
VDNKLQVVQCNNREKVLLAPHQLVGPVADWWDPNVVEGCLPLPPRTPTCHQAKEERVPRLEAGLYDNERVSEYVTCFTSLSRYAVSEVDTDDKKQKCFLSGLNMIVSLMHWRLTTLRTW